MKRLRLLNIVALFAMALNITACTTVGEVLDLDTDLRLKFSVAANVNPDDNGNPSPVIVRMYELKSPDVFSSSNFIDMYEDDKTVLAQDMVTVQRLKYLKPSEQRVENFVLSKDTKYIGLFVEFLKYEDAKYKIVVPIRQMNFIRSHAKVKLTENRIIFAQ